jgi:hypothetical protein
MGDKCHTCKHLRLRKKAGLAASQPPFLGLCGCSVVGEATGIEAFLPGAPANTTP